MARMRLADWCELEGIEVAISDSGAVDVENSDELISYLETLVVDSVAPALCDEGCEVEPDGHCEHGGKSVLLACGVV